MLEKTLESPLDYKELKPVNRKGDQPSVLNIHWKDWSWSWNSNTLATWCKELTPWKKPWSWGRLKAEGKGDDRGWDNWMTSLTRWTWVWASCRSCWWTRRPGVLQSVGLQSQTWLNNWTELIFHWKIIAFQYCFGFCHISTWISHR